MGIRERVTLITTAVILTMMLLLHVALTQPPRAKPDMRFAFGINPPVTLQMSAA